MPTREERREEILSEDIRFFLVVLLLFLFYPVGLVLMWVWTPWPTWLKLLISLPVLIGILVFFMAMVFLVGAVRGERTYWHTRPTMQQYYYRGEYVRPMMMQQAPVTLSPTETTTPTATY